MRMTEEMEETVNPNVVKEKGEVLVDGVPHLMLISDSSVMFEGSQGVWGFDRSAIRTIKLSSGKEEWNIAYSVNGEVKSVKVKPNGKWWHVLHLPPEGITFKADLDEIATPLREFVDLEELNEVAIKATYG